jgi:hypothetical protein
VRRPARILVLVVPFAIVAPRIACPANEDNQSQAWAASPDFPKRLLPLVDDLDVQLQLTFGPSRPILDGRVQYTLRVVAAWQASGRAPLDEALLEGWLRDAIVRSTPGRREPLPPLPEFSRLPERRSAPESSSKKAAQQPASDTPYDVDNTNRGAGPLPSVPALPDDVAADASELQPAAVTTPRRQPAPPSIEPRSIQPAENYDAPAIVADSSGRRDALRSPVAEPGEQLPDDDTGSIPRMAAAIELPPAQVDRPGGAAGHPAPVLEDRTVIASAGSDPRSPPASFSQEFNLREYAAQLAGHRRGIRRLEARVNELREGAVDELTECIDELERLTSQATLLGLYAQFLPPEFNTSIGQPASARDVIDSLQQLIAVGRTAIRDDRQVDAWAGLADRIDFLSDNHADSKRQP